MSAYSQRADKDVDFLASMGASESVRKQLAEYDLNAFHLPGAKAPSFPIPDEDFVEVWNQYAVEVRQAGDLSVLARYLLQLQFPTEAGTSQRAEYIAATRRGVLPSFADPLTHGSPFSAPEAGYLVVHPTAAGHIPAIVAGNREDFVALVRTLTAKNEPVRVPESMGACFVVGYNNWHRITMIRERFLSINSAELWPAEFQRVRANPRCYRDSFLILSQGPYSAVPASSFHLTHDEWLRRSMIIRLEHEAVHYFIWRLFNVMRSHLMEELIADFIGIAKAFGRFSAAIHLECLGLQNFPSYAVGGRLENYRGIPPLPEDAFAVLRKLVYEASLNLEKVADTLPHVLDLSASAALVLTLCRFNLTQLAQPSAPYEISRQLRRSIQPRMGQSRDVSFSELVDPITLQKEYSA